MYHRDGHIVNYVNATQFAAQMFGGLENLITLSLSLSQVLTYSSSHIIKIRGHPRVNIRFFLLSGKGSQLVFCLHATATGNNEPTDIFFINNLNL